MVYTLTLESTSWLATLTGESTITVYSNDSLHDRNAVSSATGEAARFGGFLFKVKGGLVLFADVQTSAADHAIGPN